MKTQSIFNIKTRRFYRQGILLIAFLLGLSPVYAQWAHVDGDRTPSSAFRGGNEADGSPLYVARTKIDGGLHVGKARANAHEAFIPYGGKEEIIDNYEVYTGQGQWVTVSGGKFPTNAIVGGNENNNTPLYIARAYLGGGWHIGKARTNATEAFIPYGGKEEIVSKFQVLVR